MTANDELRRLPSVDRLLQALAVGRSADVGHDLQVLAAREVLGRARATVLHGETRPGLDALVTQAQAAIERLTRPSLRGVINATGVIVHTNLGRAPLSEDAAAAVASLAAGYSNLEYDLDRGTRGSRYDHAVDLLCRLSGAEAGLVVNNNAAAIFLALSVLAPGREVVISRGQLVEIGGGFRIPDVLRASGARLREVGTTNRTHLSDYEQALSPETAGLMRVHFSNFRQLGFTAEVGLDALADLARTHGLWVVDDLGSGTLLDTAPFGLSPEPTVQNSVAAGADLVTFSGDKLLGGPQAGLIVGRADLIDKLRRHPLARALRVGKLTLAALNATLLHYLRGDAVQALPVWRMIAAEPHALAARAEAWCRVCRGHGFEAAVLPCASTVGGGSLPGETLPSYALALTVATPLGFSAALRRGEPPVVTRIVDDRVTFDARTVLSEQDDDLLQAIARVPA